MQQHDQNWIAAFADMGHPEAEPLAAGMEGAVYRLGDGLVAKVWGQRTERELHQLKAFYDSLAGRGLGFRIPRIQRVHTGELGVCTIEEELHGRPLEDAAPVPEGSVPGREILDRVLDVLAELASIEEPGQITRLPVLDEVAPFRPEGADWAESLIALMDRRLERFGDQLVTAIPDAEKKAHRVRELLRAWGHGREGLVHGDLITANILVEDTLRPAAVLDFGFLSTPGDPAFDVAITGSILDMYGSQARRTEAAFDDRAAQRFGYPRELLLLYRAAYAFITSNVYDSQGKDGHFRWCVDMLLREDVGALLEDHGAGREPR
ncbi:phosphotransferase family protein [Streptomyces sp. NPDC088812]|uniref:phosphotransferase family protein n=1 Tax=Streptomyces sp. NPDC088812 TaxID=3365905 RepID=UPI0037FF6E95